MLVRSLQLLKPNPCKRQLPCPCSTHVSVPQAQQLQPGAAESLSSFLGPLNPQLPGQPSISELFDASYRQTFGHSPPQSPKRHRRVMSDLGAAGSHSSSPSPQPYGHSCSHADLVQVRGTCCAFLVQDVQPAGACAFAAGWSWTIVLESLHLDVA